MPIRVRALIGKRKPRANSARTERHAEFGIASDDIRPFRHVDCAYALPFDEAVQLRAKDEAQSLLGLLGLPEALILSGPHSAEAT